MRRHLRTFWPRYLFIFAAITGVFLAVTWAGVNQEGIYREDADESEDSEDSEESNEAPPATGTKNTFSSSFTSSTSFTSSESSASSGSSESSPSSVHLRVPFSPQAPFAVWDDLHQEACEEMSLIMVHHYLEGTPLSREDADGEIFAMIAWAARNGYGLDTTAEQTAEIARNYLGYDATVYTGDDVTPDLLRELLADGKPVIVPAQGQMLGNPYFSGDGPPYHMLVIVGFDDEGNFITNDPGTRRGEGFVYAEDVLMNAIHDWTGTKETVHAGQRAVFVLEKR